MTMTVEEANARVAETFGGLLGIEIVALGDGRAAARLPLRRELLAANGFLHAGNVVALADTTCAFGTFVTLPGDAESFATLELKTNFLGTLREGAIACEAALLHGGRTTQVWDARVTNEATGKLLAVFRCTQLLLYPA